jgi:Ca-activated chloride channel family protein
MTSNSLLRFSIPFTIASILAIAYCLIQVSELTVTAQTEQSAGALMVLTPDGKQKAQCPLKHTDVKAEISGFLSRVVVTQDFENPFKEKIEAVYVFPLPQNAAVDNMSMLVGDRVVRGKILPREQAQAVYEAAKTSGQVASLLDQERPNIFTQSVANILPGEKVKITISYVETLKYENGAYEFVFPMVVAPRYVPGDSTGAGAGFAPDTTQVPDGSRITPRPAPRGMRAGHDISLDITLDAGLAIENVASKTHDVSIERADVARAHVRLKDQATIPNKDFILRYDVSGKSIQDGLLTHRLSKGGFFTMILQPPERVTVEDITPKELIFVLDTSGSMSGFPIEKAKETMKLALDNLYPADTFNLITFSGDTHILFEQPVAATPDNLQKAQAFLTSRSGGGGTEMMTAIKAALDPSDKQDHVRIVCFMTDGLVGNDMAIIDEVKKHSNARVFAFGIGGSVNRFLLDKVTEYGRGEVEYVGLNDDGSAAAKRFYERVRNPLLTDISVEWNGLPVADVYPQRIPDLFSAKPVILTGRYLNGAAGTIRLKGKMSGNDFVRDIPVQFPDNEARHDVLAALWARQRIDDLMGQDYGGLQRSEMKPELKETITQLGLEYRLMTQFTSFVAVEEMVVTDGGQPRRIDVPVEVPEGMRRDAIYGEADVLRVGSSKNLSSFYSVGGSPGQVVTRSGSKSKRAAGAGGGGGGAGVGSGSGRGISAGGSGNVGAGSMRPSGTVQPPSAPPAARSVANAVVIDGAGTPEPPPSADELRRRQLRAKGDAAIVALIERLKKNDTNAAPTEARFVSDGKAELQIWLVDKSEKTLAELKALGFELMHDSKASMLVIGRVPISKLEALLDLKSVRYVAPLLKN